MGQASPESSRTNIKSCSFICNTWGHLARWEFPRVQAPKWVLVAEELLSLFSWACSLPLTVFLTQSHIPGFSKLLRFPQHRWLSITASYTARSGAVTLASQTSFWNLKFPHPTTLPFCIHLLCRHTCRGTGYVYTGPSRQSMNHHIRCGLCLEDYSKDTVQKWRAGNIKEETWQTSPQPGSPCQHQWWQAVREKIDLMGCGDITLPTVTQPQMHQEENVRPVQQRTPCKIPSQEHPSTKVIKNRASQRNCHSWGVRETWSRALGGILGQKSKSGEK